ncbi:signal transduction histidine kinase regulating citrate/malate metabolism [Thermosinus carboxydivorans Nor1]|uniref:histidine kinase n=1 Tax=Thermosinus carboxydivorans Nor1 TaxID=401526 RepID=A1HNG3_9FIRM|nr:signal transduction histidine kinase regulating citrate/malate metabolism [Thermosinus carboxydivorans Nor1]
MLFEKNMKLRTKILLLSLATMCLTLALVGVLVYNLVSDHVQTSVGNRALAIARVVARVPTVQEAIMSDNPSAVLQPFAERWREATGAAFIIISNMQEVRLSYPVPSMVGTPMAPWIDREPVLRGEEYVYIAQGNLAPSLRANAPIYAPDGSRQIGFVSVGFYLDDIYTITRKTVEKLLVVLVVAAAVSSVGAGLLARNVKQATFGLEPREIATILKEREATLEAIREGVIAVDTQKIIRVINNEAARILGVDADASRGLLIDQVLPDNRLADVLREARPIQDEEQRVGEIIIMANSVPIVVDGKVVGAVISFRDRTEINRLAEELTGVHRLVDVLRAQAHEFKNKLHTIAGLIQLGRYDEAVNFAIDSQLSQQGLFTQLAQIKDAVIYGLLVGKTSQMKEQGIEFTIDPDASLEQLPVNVASGDIVLILGNLLQNAVEALAASSHKAVWVSIRQQADKLMIIVRNSGPTIDETLAAHMYKRGVTTKPTGSGLGLALVAEKLKLVGGAITHRNLEPTGVEFTVVIPYGRG